MELWYTEKQTPNLGFSCKITRTLHTERTEYQDLAVIDTVQFGKMLVLDGMVMTTEVDEFVYHEMISHIALNTHPHPKKVLVVGGGDGGVIREVLKHQSVQEAVLAEIDDRVVKVSQEYLPGIAGALTNPRVTLAIGDGVEHVRQNKNKYDVIFIDSTEPIGPAVGLFSREFYQDVYSQGLIDSSFGAYYSGKSDYGQSMIVGQSDDPKRVYQLVIELMSNKMSLLSEDAFLRVKKKEMGRFLMGLNSVEFIANNLTDLYFQGFLLQIRLL